MKANSAKTVQITVVLTEDEALWLRSLMQNPHPLHGEEEPADVAKHRHGLFHALDNALYGSKQV